MTLIMFYYTILIFLVSFMRPWKNSIYLNCFCWFSIKLSTLRSTNIKPFYNFQVSALEISAWKINDSSYLLKVLRCENSNCNLEVVSFVNAVRDNDSYQFRSNNRKIPTIKHMIMSYFFSSYVMINRTNGFDIFYKIQMSNLVMVYCFKNKSS